MHRDSLRDLGRALYGDRYATSLAEALAEQSGKKVAPSHIVMWTKGPRSIPAWVGEAAFRVAEQGVRELEARTVAVKSMLAAPWEHDMPTLPPAD